jgi:hypothetical protein
LVGFGLVFGYRREQGRRGDGLDDAVENDDHGAQGETGRGFFENGLEFADGAVAEVRDLRAIVSGLLELGVRKGVLKLRAGSAPVGDGVAVNADLLSGLEGLGALHE